MTFRTITEGQTKIVVPVEKKISKKLPIFYNPVMALNRDLSVLLLTCWGNTGLSVGDPLAGTGIRSIRFLKELPPGTIRTVWMNDYNAQFLQRVSQSLLLNDVATEQSTVTSFFNKQDTLRTATGLQSQHFEKEFTAYNKQVLLSSLDANLFLLLSPGFDYIEIDPFGSPNAFLDAACMRLARGGILAVTATDTSALCGTYTTACRRKYWAEPSHNELMHELGLRILIRKVQLIAAQYDKALTPLFSYDRDHYMRVFFSCEKGKTRVDKIMKQHATFMTSGKNAGPLWMGSLCDSALVHKMLSTEERPEHKKFLQVIHDESLIASVGFYDIHAQCKRHGIKEIPRTERVLEHLHKKKHPASRTQFSPTGIRTTASEDVFLSCLR
jgi:tRNA (guanine26-N2/guanine27-N2)-dimethyltransferase